MEKLNIRVANMSDSMGLAKVHVKSWQATYKGIIPESYLNNLSIEKRSKNWETFFNKGKPDTIIYIAELDTSIIGFCNVGVNRDEDIDKTLFGELWGIYIHPEYLNKGIGSSLMKQGLDYLKNKGYKHATLWVLAENVKARKFYENKGWRVEGKTKIEPRQGFNLNEIRYVIDL